MFSGRGGRARQPSQGFEAAARSGSMTRIIIVKEAIDRLNAILIGPYAFEPGLEALRAVEDFMPRVRKDIMLANPADVEEIGGGVNLDRQIFIIRRDPADAVLAEQISRSGDMPGSMAELDGVTRA